MSLELDQSQNNLASAIQIFGVFYHLNKKKSVSPSLKEVQHKFNLFNCLTVVCCIIHNILTVNIFKNVFKTVTSF